MARKWYHLIFLVAIAAVLTVLYLAPEVKTPRLPSDANHADIRNFAQCPSCHGPGSKRPMPRTGEKIHVIADGSVRGEFVKCYMCHKRAKV